MDTLHLAVLLTPPKPDSTEAHMSTSEFLNSSPTIERIKRKASFTHLSSRAKKYLRLEPSPQVGEMTVSQHQQYTINACSREKIMVMIPLDGEWSDMRDEMTKMREDAKNHLDLTYQLRMRIEGGEKEKARTAETMEGLVVEINQLKRDCEGQVVEINQLKKDSESCQEMKSQRLGLFIGNSAVDLARTVYPRREYADHSTTQLQQLAPNTTNKQLTTAKVPTKYWHIVRKLPDFIEARNQSAHESEVEFARFLIREGPESGNYQFWKDIFPCLYNGTMDEVARRQTVHERVQKLALSNN